MNYLETLKQKLMVKPTVEEREKVAVIINGTTKIQKNPKIIQKQPESEKEEGEESEDDDEGGESEDIEDKDDESENDTLPITKIVDETNTGFDRASLLKRLTESKQSKVSIQSINKIVERNIEQPTVTTIQKVKPSVKKLKKVVDNPRFIIEDEDDDDDDEPNKNLYKITEGDEDADGDGEGEGDGDAVENPNTVVAIKVPKQKGRITKNVVKGVAILGPETLVEIGDTPLSRRLPKKSPPVLIKVSDYYMNNREIFVNFINSLFEPYRKEINENKESISCDTIGKTSTQFSLLTHQKIVRDYINLYTPYRGLLLYHGLGSGKTCTSIAIAEGMKDSKRVVVMTPASLRANYMEELKKCGDLIYKRNQYWEWISVKDQPDTLATISVLLNLPQEYIVKRAGAFFINVKKASNYEALGDADKKVLEEQLNEMILQKYTFINYNGLRAKRLSEFTEGFTKNIFDNCVVVIDEAHNLISRIVNKLKREKPHDGEESRQHKKRGEEEKDGDKTDPHIFGEYTPISLAVKLYYMLLRAKNARIILLTGTPIINYPNEFAILFNILRGYIKTWKIPLVVGTENKLDKATLNQLLVGNKSHDYLDYSPSSKILTITRNPFGFKNKTKNDGSYQGVSNVAKKSSGELGIDGEDISDEDFEKNIIRILSRNAITVVPAGIKVINKKALPDGLDEFQNRYINYNDNTLNNLDALKRRIIGLSSYFKSAQESLLPRYNKQIGEDYHIIRIPMSDTQFRIYESARKKEREFEKKKKKPSPGDDLFKEQSSTYRIFSRLFCNFVMPERPIPIITKKDKEKDEEKDKGETNNINKILKEGTKVAYQQGAEDDREGEVEGDQVLDEIGGITYKEQLTQAIDNIAKNSNDFLTPEALQTYSPKFLHMLENITDKEHLGLHLVYSQFRTAEGIGLFCLVLEKNGFARFKIKKNHVNVWVVDINDADLGKPTYALYTGTETSEEKEIIRHIYNGEWDQIPDSISVDLNAKYKNNNMGEAIKVFMITSSGSEGINLKNTRYVHIMEPYWHPVRSEQVIGRARRICSHKELPLQFQTVEVFVYIMTFSESQLKSDEAIELKRGDLSKSIPRVAITSDQYLFEISEIKAKLTSQLTDAIKESAFDCYIYSNGKCMNFGDPANNKMSYVPDYTDQQNDAGIKANKIAVQWTGKQITINNVQYVYRRVSPNVLDLYDKTIYENAMKDPSIQPLKVGSYEQQENGDKVVKWVD
ncbi:helicase-related protein [bacterium]|nr:helicase-related protein [bacterium]